MKFVQINLHHSSSVPVAWCENGICSIIQESSNYVDQIYELMSLGEQIFLFHLMEMQDPTFISGTILMPCPCWGSMEVIIIQKDMQIILQS
jgi:hypothetical protein